MSPKRPRARGGATAGWSLAAAVALFAVLCGLALLLASGGGGTARREDARGRVVKALGELERATQAIDAADYGVARTRVQRARASLTELVPEGHASR
jgi:hypothetical protein